MNINPISKMLEDVDLKEYMKLLRSIETQLHQTNDHLQEIKDQLRND